MMRVPLLLISGLLLALLLIGLRRDLPLAYEADEALFAVAALGMNERGTLNPGWFGHPGATTIYPAALLYRLHAVARDAAPLVGPDPAIRARYDADFTPFYLIGRALSIGYLLASVGVLAALGSQVFDRQTALVAAALFVVNPEVVYWAQQMRSDAAATFWSLATLLALTHHARSGRRRMLAVGSVALGLALASRYFMAALLPALAIVVLFAPLPPERAWWRRLARLVAAGVLALAVFALANPYLLLDRVGVAYSFGLETRDVQYGHDGLNFWQHLGWYLFVALPAAVGWPQLAALAVGGVAVLRAARRQTAARLALPLLTFGAALLIGTSLLSLHWQRWLYQIYPLAALLAAHALVTFVTWLRLRRPALLTGGLLALLLLYPAGHVARAKAAEWRVPSTRMQATRWIADHVPPGSTLFVNRYAAIPIAGYTFIEHPWNPPQFDYDALVAAGARTFALNMTYDAWFRADPARYGALIAFYDRVMAEGTLAATFTTGYQPPIRSLYDGRAEVRIYRLPDR